MTKRDFFRVCRALRPDLTRAQFNKMWDEFVIAREKHYKLKASLRLIQGGKT